MRRISNVPEKSLRLISQDCKSNFDKLSKNCREIINSWSLHKSLMTEIYKYLHEIFTLITNGVFSLIKTIFNFRKYELSEYANPLYKIAFHLSCGRTCQAISKSPIWFFIAGSGALDMKNISSQIFVSYWYYFVDCFTFPVTIHYWQILFGEFWKIQRI